MVLKFNDKNIALYAEMMAAMGIEHRLHIIRLLLKTHPDGMVVGDIQAELAIPGSTLSHHLEKLKIVGLVNVKRESQFMRYSANTEALQNLLAFLFDECCSRSNAIEPKTIAKLCMIDAC